MRRSEIFESFVKIAQEKGLLSDSEYKPEHTEKDFHETNPRHDSLSIEQIGKLYNTKPERPKDMDYEHNIMEDAHPDSIVISPSYDKLNGLVENENEGQNIRLRIVMKQPDGHLTQRKYARKNLIMSLVRVANELDNRDGNDELRKLADACLKQASKKKIEKKAYAWLIIGAIVAAAGVLYAKQHLRFHSDGWNADYEKAEKEINDLLTSSSSWGVGYDYTPEFLQTVHQLQTVLAEIDTAVKKVMPILDEVQTPRTGTGISQEITRISQDSATKAADAAMKELRAVMTNNLPFIRKVLSDFSSSTYKQRAIANKGALSSLVDSTEILHGGAGLVADDFDDVAHALMTLRVDLVNIIKELKAGANVQQQLQSDLQASQAESDLMLNPSDEKKPEQAASGTEKPSASPFAALEDATKGLMPSFFSK